MAVGCPKQWGREPISSGPHFLPAACAKMIDARALLASAGSYRIYGRSFARMTESRPDPVIQSETRARFIFPGDTLPLARMATNLRNGYISHEHTEQV